MLDMIDKIHDTNFIQSLLVFSTRNYFPLN